MLEAPVDSSPIEVADVMTPDTGHEPGVFAGFRALLPGLQVEPHGRWDFHGMARGRDIALAVSTGDQRIYANILLTIGVRLADAGDHPTGDHPTGDHPPGDR